MANNTKVQVDLMQRIQRAKDNFKKSPKERLRSKDYLNTRYQMLESLWEQFSLTHTQIVLDTEPETLQESAYVSNEVYNKTEELYIDYSFEIKSALSALEGRSSTGCETTKTGAEPSTSNIRLPKITIPVFSGKYSEWTTFYDLFRSLIHNNKSLDDVQKLHYLKGHLVGEAEQLVRHISVTKDNYRICWEQLEKRYNNKKYLANLILKRLMSQRNLTSESANGIKELLDTTNECLHALENIGVNVSSWDIIIIHIICLKLDPETRKQWELKCSELSEDLPTLPQFYGFLETRFRALEFVEPKTFKGTSNSFSNKSSSNCFNKGSNAPTNPKIHHVTAQSCMYCSEDHKICNCKSFAKIDTDARRDFVQSNRLCFNCLGVNHSVFACRQSTRCRICQKKHHSLLHPRNTTSATDSQVSNQSVERSVAVHNASASLSARDESNCTEIKSHFSTSRNQVLLATALVKAQSRNGSGITLRCLLDQGSQASLITESAVQLLGLKKIQHNSTISGLGSDEGASLASKSMVKVNIQSLLDPRFNYDVNAFVLNKLTADLPEKAVVVELWSALDKFELADPSFDRPNKIDMLLGADVYGQIIEEGIIKGSSGAPVAQKTTLGWILSGPIHTPDLTKPNHIKVNHVQVSDNELLKKFWELETDIPLKSPNFTDEEIKCEELFKTTTKRDSTGRYIVKLPFRDEDPSCKYGNSEAIATRRFLQLERRFAKDPQLKARYTDVIEEYLELGHMEQVAETEKQKDHVVYLPHHAVIREDKTTSKLRVVFDASCPGTNGVSLNQDLLVGPALQADLRHIILKWRMHPICLVADIVKMYRQVKVHEVDADFQRIVWRAKPDDEIGHFKLLRVTFGTASAPYLAVRALHQVAYDEGANLPLAAERVLNHFYMDDLLTGCQTVEEGKKIYKETTLEERGKKLCFLNTCENNNGVSPANELMSRFSSLRRLIRVMAFCKRFTKLCQGQAGSKWLTSPEIRDSLLSCIKLVQQEHFQEEILSIKNKKCINKKSKLTSVNPTLDHEEILRVGGRLQHAQISEAMKHPIILPHKSHLTDLVVADAHQKTLHGAPQLMLNYLRSKYWIVGAKNLVNLFVRRCVICIRYAAATQHQLMGQLPSARSSITRPFCQSGVDYAGPINIRTSKGRGHHAYKGYICLFICMATRAIHLEPVSDLTSQGFLAAFKRFVARRGRCTDLWSDNGTNFVGAARELKHLFADEKSSMLPEIIDDLATNGTHWHFIPPHSPNFGGLWEAGIKSTKYHLKRVIGNSTLTYEEMATVLSQVEACLNSRPMSKLTDNSNDPMPLTPGHFLVGEPLVLAPDYNYEAANINNLRRWQLTQRMVQDFWRRWSREYLTQFYHRYKWGHQKPEPVVGDVVLIKEDDLPPGKWLYGRITDKHPGLDGITRVVSLKYKGGIIKRSVGKICVLPIET